MGKKDRRVRSLKKTGQRSVARAKKVRVYADAAAATPLDPFVEKRLISLLPLFGNPGGLHKDALLSSQELERARKEIAEVLGAHPDEIIFTASGTEANNIALLGVMQHFLKTAPHAHVLTLPIEHPSIIEPLKSLEGKNCSVEYLQVDEGGVLLPKTLREAVKEDTVLVSVQMVNSEIGTLQDIRALAREVRHAKKERLARGNTCPLYFHSDAAQAPLYVPLKVDTLGVDLLSIDAQKILGPKGVGALFVRRGIELGHVLLGGHQERGRRPGTENAPLCGALAEALMRAQKGTEARAKRVGALRDLLLAQIRRAIPDVIVNGSLESRSPNNLNISIPGLEGEVAVIALDALGVAASTRSACSTGEVEPSQALLSIGATPERARGAIRLTLLPSVSREDVRHINEALLQVCDLYREKRV